MFDLMICNIEHTTLIEYNFSAYFNITMHVQVLPALPPEGGGEMLEAGGLNVCVACRKDEC